jgi:type II secretory pathway pseudopilin PulG
MEPVFMVLSQSAAQAAIYAIDHNTGVQGVNVKAIKQSLMENPLADGNTPDIIVDDNDKQHVTIQGNWQTGTNGYGPTMLISDTTGTSTKALKYLPEIKKEGSYELYTYSSANNKTPFQVSVFDGRSTKKMVIDPAQITIEGQTSGEWISLGKYNLPAGSNAWVEITAIHNTDKIQADAMLFVPER